MIRTGLAGYPCAQATVEAINRIGTARLAVRHIIFPQKNRSMNVSSHGACRACTRILAESPGLETCTDYHADGLQVLREEHVVYCFNARAVAHKVTPDRRLNQQARQERGQNKPRQTTAFHSRCGLMRGCCTETFRRHLLVNGHRTSFADESNHDVQSST